jgi:predicted ester cyclase
MEETESNKAVVRRYYDEVLNLRRVGVFDELADPAFVSYLASGDHIDLQIYKQAIYGSLSAMPDLHVTINDQIAEGDKVVTRWTAKGTPRVEFAGLQPNGESVKVTAIHIHRIRNHRLVEHWEAINLHAIKHEAV